MFKNFFKDKLNRKEKIAGTIMIVGLILFTGFLYFPQDEKEVEEKVVINKPVVIEEEAKEIPEEIKNFGISIEKIDVLAPIVANVSGFSKKAYNDKLREGVAHLDQTSLPGQGNNIFIFGHSSSLIGDGPYSEIFSKLDNLEKGNDIVVYYQNTEHYYSIEEKRIVSKNEVSVAGPTEDEQLTLMTCWPLGTDEKRLIVTAKPKIN
jgi:sortase A